VINDIKLAQAEKAAAQAALQQAQAELVHLRAVQQSLSAQLKLAQTEKTRNAIRKQLKANTDALTAATNQQTAAQARLDVAMKATSFPANGLRSAMALLGGPAGMLFLAAGALSMWSSKIDEAKQKSLEPGDKVDQLREKYKSLNQEQKQLELSRLKVFFDKTKESIDWQIVAVKELKAEYEQYKRRAAGALNSIFTLQEGLNEAQNKYLEASDKLKKSQENLAKAEKARSDIESGAIEKTNEATEANKNLSKSWDKVSQSEIDKKLASLSKELDIAQLKAKKIVKRHLYLTDFIQLWAIVLTNIEKI
jgi:chromosome segregation ATPase